MSRNIKNNKEMREKRNTHKYIEIQPTTCLSLLYLTTLSSIFFTRKESQYRIPFPRLRNNLYKSFMPLPTLLYNQTLKGTLPFNRIVENKWLFAEA